MIRRLLVPVTAAALFVATVPLAAATAAVAAPPAPVGVRAAGTASVYTACYRKKSGEIRMLTKKRCPKGWKKIRWNATGPIGPLGPVGPAGPVGPVGPAMSVVDSAGTVLGTFMGLRLAGLEPTYFVRVADGGLWEYYSIGRVVEHNVEVLFTNSSCSGQAYGFVKPGSEASVGPAGRVALGVNGVVQSAYRWGTSSIPAAGVPIWWRNYSGVCTSETAKTGGLLWALAGVDLPPQGTGPLTVS